VSPSDKAEELNSKVSEYLANGSQEVWLIYPKDPRALVFGPGSAVRTEHSVARASFRDSTSRSKASFNYCFSRPFARDSARFASTSRFTFRSSEE
jgi:hypothetical protein